MRKSYTYKTFIPLIIIVSCSFLIIGCPNPILEQALDPKKITFETNGGTHVDSQTIFRDQKISRPKDPAKSGYNFEGWFEDILNDSHNLSDYTLIQPGTEWGSGIAEDYTLYAVWSVSQ